MDRTSDDWKTTLVCSAIVAGALAYGTVLAGQPLSAAGPAGAGPACADTCNGGLVLAAGDPARTP